MGRHHTWTFAAAVTLAAIPSAHAQTGAGLIRLPWEEGESFELDFDVLDQDDTGTDDAPNRDVKPHWYSGDGRWRLNPAEEFHPTIGFEFEHIELTSSHPAVPDRLADASIGVGPGLAETDRGAWLATVAIGFAFGQEIERGWDSRDLDTIVELDDAPYVRAGLEMRFW